MRSFALVTVAVAFLLPGSGLQAQPLTISSSDPCTAFVIQQTAPQSPALALAEMNTLNAGPPPFFGPAWTSVARRNANGCPVAFTCPPGGSALAQPCFVSTLQPDPSAEEVTVNNCSSAWYRFTFTLPPGYSNASLDIDVSADDLGIAYLNGVRISGTLLSLDLTAVANADIPALDLAGATRGVIGWPNPDNVFVPSSGPFQLGQNELVIGVHGNASAFDPTGLEFWGTVTWTNPPTPSISSLNPGMTLASPTAGNLILTVNGSGFLNGSSITWNGSALNTTFSSSTSLLTSVPGSFLTSAGSAQVRVQNPVLGQSPSNAATFSIVNPVPLIGSLSPPFAVLQSLPGSLTVIGSGYLPGVTAVTLDGAPVTPISMSSGSMTLPTNGITNPGAIALSVSNPGPGGGTRSATWPVKAAQPTFTLGAINPANGHRYFVSSLPVSIDEARFGAARVGGTLLSLEDAAEEAWVEATLGTAGSAWLGLDLAAPGPLLWASGAPASYLNWCGGSPGGGPNAIKLAGAASCWQGAGGHPVSDRHRAVIEVAPGFQTNRPGATMTLNGNATGGFDAERVDVATGGQLSVNGSSVNAGLPWDLLLSPRPLLAATAGGFTTTSGQILNLDVTDPALSAVTGFSTGFAPFSWNLAVTQSLFLSTQMVVLSPSVPEAFELSAAFEVRAQTGNFVTLSGPTSDDGSVLIQIPAGFPMVRFQDADHSDFYVNANGSVSFGAPVESFLPSPGGMSSGPDRLAGMWTDLDPGSSGDIRVELLAQSALAGRYEVIFDDVWAYDAGASSGNSFLLQFLPGQNTASIQNYAPDPNHSLDTAVGMSGASDPTFGLGYSFSGLANSGCQMGQSGEAVFEFTPAAEVPVGWTDIFFPNGNSTMWFVN